ncbi:HAD-like protein [Acephala macrosclerotiorum]|nr:HAD-like protein [Acephala macrosclerotiorum]
MAASKPKHIVFDIVGTLVAYEKIWDSLETRLGPKLQAEGIKPSLLGYTWLEATEREYTYLSLSGRYVPFKRCFELLFWRMLWMAGIKEPREFATKEDLDYVMEQYLLLEMRPGAKECVEKLREAGFTVWAFTAGDLSRVGGYFKHAGIEMPEANLLSCDTTGIGKPSPEAYMPLLKQLREDGEEPWFAAAHMWDVSAARTTGFKGAYCTIWEKEPLQELFGDMEVIADTLPEMADKVIAAAS